MRLAISEARGMLPGLVRRVRADAVAMVQIMVHEEALAELRAALPEPPPGAAAKALFALARRQPSAHRRRVFTSAIASRRIDGYRHPAHNHAASRNHGLSRKRSTSACASAESVTVFASHATPSAAVVVP